MTIARLVLLVLAVAASGFLYAQDAACPDPSKCPVSARPEEMKWQKVLPDLGPEGPEFTILRVDPRTRATALMVRAIKETYIPWHWHSPNETNAVLSGKFTYECEGKVAEMSAGSFNFFPARLIHRAWLSEGCTLFISAESAWDLNWVEGPPQARLPDDAPAPTAGATGAFEPEALRFDGVPIEAIEVMEAPGRRPAPRWVENADRRTIVQLLHELEPSETRPSGGECAWVVSLRAGKGGAFHVLWVTETGEWGYGGRARGRSANLARMLENLLASSGGAGGPGR